MRQTLLLTLIVAAALAVSCSKKKGDGQDKEAAPADKATPTEPPADPAPDKSAETPPPAAAPEVDCEKLLTADDVAKACGAKAAEFQVQKNPMETTGKGGTACMRNAIKSGNRIYLLVNAASGSTKTAREILDLAKMEQGAKAVEAGDGAYLVVREVAAAKQTSHELAVVKGTLWFKVGFDLPAGDKKPICSDDGLVELGKTVASRLP